MKTITKRIDYLEQTRDRSIIWMSATLVMLLVSVELGGLWPIQLAGAIVVFIYFVYIFALSRALGEGKATTWLLLLLNLILFPAGAAVVGLMALQATKAIKAARA